MFTSTLLTLIQCGGKHYEKCLHKGVSGKIINIKNLYKNSKCYVNNDGKHKELFSVLVASRQYLLSPTLFNIFLEFITQEIQSMSDEFELMKTWQRAINMLDAASLISLIYEKL